VYAIYTAFAQEIFGLHKVTTSPHESGTKRTGTRFLTPLDIPVLSAAIGDIYFGVCSRQVLIDELEWRLWLVMGAATTVFEVESIHVARIPPQDIFASRSCLLLMTMLRTGVKTKSDYDQGENELQGGSVHRWNPVFAREFRRA
jgi:hypothetical protein